jgi:hypothetical protein
VDGYIIKCLATRKITISMLDNAGHCLEIKLHNVMDIPGISQRLFFITHFLLGIGTVPFLTKRSQLCILLPPALR